MSDEPQQTLLPERDSRGEGGVTAQCMAMMHQTDTTVIDSWLQHGRLAAETDMLPHTDTGHGLLSQVKWRDIGCSLHGPLSLYHLPRVRCEGGDLMR